MSLFRCPLCAAPLTAGERTYTCPQGHSFDRAREGYVHLLPANQKHAKDPGDDKAMAAARGRFLDGGWYAPLREALSAFVRSAREVFDDIVLDTAAGMGAPFLAAMAVCDMCVIVITPDPVAMRDGRIVCDAVAAAGCENIRLVINRVPRRAADAAVGDFDLCIDTVGAQLLGVVPESAALAAACASGKGLAQAEPAHAVFRAIAARLCGERVPLIVR